jgi:ERCC4-related helicase
MFSPEDLERLRKLDLLITRLTEQQDALTARGVDVPALIAQCRKQYEEYVKSCQEQERAVEDHLQAQANLADAEYQLYLSVKKQVEAVAESEPNHPQLPQWRETLEQWSKNLPASE